MSGDEEVGAADGEGHNLDADLHATVEQSVPAATEFDWAYADGGGNVVEEVRRVMKQIVVKDLPAFIFLPY